MQSFQTQYTKYQALSNNSQAGNVTLGKQLLNESDKKIASMKKWPFLEIVKTLSTVASQSPYQIPAGIRKISDLWILVGTTKYMPIEIEDPFRWKQVLAANLGESDGAMFYYRQDKKVLIEPTPASSSNTIYFRSRKRFKDRTAADYSTGTITSVAANGVAVVGSGTTWTSAMAGRYIRITGNGDGLWYEILSVTDTTHLTLVEPYEGTAISAATEAYSIGEMSILPEGYEDASVWRSLAIYFSQQGEIAKAKMYWLMYDGGVEAGYTRPENISGLIGQMIEDQTEKTEGAYLSPEEPIMSSQTIISPFVPPSDGSGFS